jgi:hypothetical protein
MLKALYDFFMLAVGFASLVGCLYVGGMILAGTINAAGGYGFQTYGEGRCPECGAPQDERRCPECGSLVG